MIKPVTFQGTENFKANLYALEVRSRFVNQNVADGYYSGYGDELAATVLNNIISIGTGAFLVQGRLIEVETAESLSVAIENGKYGIVAAHIETLPAANDYNCSLIIKTGTNISSILSSLTQEDTYAHSAEMLNKVYELPLYYFIMQNDAITITEKAIKEINPAPDILNRAYPVGAIYISTENTSPANLFGGTWEQIKDVFILAAGDNYNAGETGGSKDAIVVEHRHSHTFYWAYVANGEAGHMGATDNTTALMVDNSGRSVNKPTEYKGESGTGKNMPPYLVAYMWKRIS